MILKSVSETGKALLRLEGVVGHVKTDLTTPQQSTSFAGK